MRDYARISAPFSGLVTAKSVEPGNLAAPGAPLLTVEREGAYRLEASVDESRLPFVKTGQTVDVALDSLDRRLQRPRLGNRAGGGCGFARLRRENRSARRAESAVRHVRARMVPHGRSQGGRPFRRRPWWSAGNCNRFS